MGMYVQCTDNCHDLDCLGLQGKNRSRKIEELVLPEIERSKPIVAKQVFEGMKKARIRGDKEYLKEVHMKKTLEVVSPSQTYFQLTIHLASESSQRSERPSSKNTNAAPSPQSSCRPSRNCPSS